MERERKRKEEEEKRLKEAEAERKIKAEMEAKRKIEEQTINHALEADRRAASEIQEKLNEENRKLREQIGISCPFVLYFVHQRAFYLLFTLFYLSLFKKNGAKIQIFDFSRVQIQPIYFL